MVAATQVAELRAEQSRIARSVSAEMLALYGALDFKAIDATSPAFIEASVSVADRWHREASLVGADMYLSMRREAGVAGGFVVARPEFDAQRLRNDLIVLGPVAAKKLLSRGVRIPDAAKRVFTMTAGRVSKNALAGVRDTVSASTVRDEQAFAYARQTRAGACDFCIELAGNTYLSAESAMQSSGTRKRSKAPQPTGEKFHDHCQCVLVTIFKGELPDGSRLTRKAYSEAWYKATQQGLSHEQFLANSGLEYVVQ